MSNIDHLGLDGYALRTFLAVLEEGSVTKAAGRLGVSQSAVSHTLEKLRSLFDDPLFVRDGRGITPSAKALSLREPVEEILGSLKSLSDQGEFDPARDVLEFTISANGFPVVFIFPPLLRTLDAEGIDLRLNLIPAGIPSANLARASNCHMLITPAPPNKKGIHHVPLIESKMVCFYDPDSRTPPRTLQQYIGCRHIDVSFSPTESSQMVLPASLTAVLNEPVLRVPDFNAVTPFIKGTDLITTQLSAMEYGSLRDLAWAPLPFKTDPLSLSLLWHERYDDDPAHRWLRERIVKTVKTITSS